MPSTYTAWIESVYTRNDSRGKHTDPVKIMSLHDILPTAPNFFFLICNKPKVKFMHSSNQTKHYRNKCIHFTSRKRDFASDKLEHIIYSSRTRDGQISPAQTTVKVNCKLLSQCQYWCGICWLRRSDV
jgi:hypothetical protein